MTWTHIVGDVPWPERVGLRCRIVPKPADVNHYPWTTKARSEVVVLIEDDPFQSKRGWSCVLAMSDLTPWAPCRECDGLGSWNGKTCEDCDGTGLPSIEQDR